MAFDDMPDLGPLLLPGAAEYAAQATAWSREAVASTRTLLDVPYGEDFYQKLDIFLPSDTPVRAVPVLVFMHGGAWKNGFKEWMGFMAPPLVTLPSIFISVNYRLVPRVKYPLPLDDCCAALAWVRANIARHGGDPQRIYIGGHSAGGHLAALVALHAAKLEAHGLPRDIIKGCFPLSASLSLDRAEGEPGSRREAIIKLILQDHDDGRDGTVLSHADGNRVPFLLAHGSEDLPDLLAQNRRFTAALVDQPCSFARQIIPGADHFASNLACRDPESVWVRSVREWMSRSG